jgi:hypothetical protein
MHIFLFTDNKKIEGIFSTIKKSKGNTIITDTPAALKKKIQEIDNESLVYLDTGKLTVPELKKNLTLLSKLNNIYFGIIDPKGTAKDVAELFHSGTVDYIGKEQVKNNIPSKRINSVLTYIQKIYGEDAGIPEDEMLMENFISSGSDWKKIQPGREYSSCFMLIELDNQKELKGKYGDINTGKFVSEFRDLVARKFAEINGRVWMWRDFGGLILFPFDGTKCDPLISIFRFYMDLRITIAEEFSYDDILSFRTVLHIGNTEYMERGETGEVVADSVNSIFHLGQKFAKPGSFVLTENLFKFLPGGIKDYFIDEGVFEGRQIKRMKRLL